MFQPKRSPLSPALVSGALGALLLTGAGCLSTQTQSSLDGSQPASPFVEAYVEYPGPQDKWSGPASFVLHVTAKDKGFVQIVTAPAWASEEAKAVPIPAPKAVEVHGRVPASVLSKTANQRQMGAEEARELIAQLHTAIQGAGAPFKGCMSPVRVRLVRADGGLVEKQGCRSEIGWARAVSETVNVFVSASVHGYPPEPSHASQKPVPSKAVSVARQ